MSINDMMYRNNKFYNYWVINIKGEILEIIPDKLEDALKHKDVYRVYIVEKKDKKLEAFYDVETKKFCKHKLPKYLSINIKKININTDTEIETDTNIEKQILNLKKSNIDLKNRYQRLQSKVNSKVEYNKEKDDEIIKSLETINHDLNNKLKILKNSFNIEKTALKLQNEELRKKVQELSK